MEAHGACGGNGAPARSIVGSNLSCQRFGRHCHIARGCLPGEWACCSTAATGALRVANLGRGIPSGGGGVEMGAGAQGHARGCHAVGLVARKLPHARGPGRLERGAPRPPRGGAARRPPAQGEGGHTPGWGGDAQAGGGQCQRDEHRRGVAPGYPGLARRRALRARPPPRAAARRAGQ